MVVLLIMLSSEVNICYQIPLGDYIKLNTKSTLCWNVQCCNILTDFGWLYPGEAFVSDAVYNFVTSLIIKILPGVSKYRIEFEIPTLTGGIYTITYHVDTGVTNTTN